MTPKQALKYYKTRSAMCKKFQWSKQRVHKWFKAGRIPVDCQHRIAADSGLPVTK